MNIEFEHLEQIPLIMVMIKEILQLLQQGNLDKRWLSVKELGKYISFSESKISKMLGVEFIEGEHFHKRENRNLFDKHKIDEWVLNTPSSNNLSFRDTKSIVRDVLSTAS